MREAAAQSFENLRANTLRSVLTMFGILWGVISIVVLAAMGEGFRQGNDTVLRELGRNIAIVGATGRRCRLGANGLAAGSCSPRVTHAPWPRSPRSSPS
jgi:putative ABC transport system permease protein